MKTLLRIYAVAVLLFLLAPLIVVLPLSFSANDMMGLPVRDVSLRWYRDFFTDSHWQMASRNSLLVGLATMVLATSLGTLAALGIRFGGRQARIVLALLCLPIVVPSVIAGLAIYLVFARLGLVNTLAGLVLAHSVLALPFVVLTVHASLRDFDPQLLRAASSLGAKPGLILRAIILPLLAPAIGTGAVFAFTISFDELIVALFIAGPEQFTLPRQMLASARDTLSPTLAVAAVLVSAASLVLLGFYAVLQRRRGLD